MDIFEPGQHIKVGFKLFVGDVRRKIGGAQTINTHGLAEIFDVSEKSKHGIKSTFVGRYAGRNATGFVPEFFAINHRRCVKFAMREGVLQMIFCIGFCAKEAWR